MSNLLQSRTAPQEVLSSTETVHAQLRRALETEFLSWLNGLRDRWQHDDLKEQLEMFVQETASAWTQTPSSQGEV